MKEEDTMEDTEDRKNWKVGPINVAKALIDIEKREQDPSIFLYSMFISLKSLTLEFMEFKEKVCHARNDLLNEELMLQKQQEDATK